MRAVEKRSENRSLELLKRAWRDYSVLLVFIAIIGICAVAAPRFLRMDNLLNILRNTSTVGAIALGMTFVIIAGGIDLSSGPVLAVSGAVLILLQRMVNADGSPAVPLAFAVLACLAVATSFGFLNGIIITKAKLPPFIVTLAVGIMARSLVMYFMRGATVMGNNIPQFTSIGNGSVFSVPIPFILVVAVAIIFHIFLTRSKFGTYVFAVIPGDAELDFKKLARAAGLRKAEMAPLKDVQPLTGYIRGGVTVFGAKKVYPVFVDETAILFDKISVSAGARGTQLVLSPEDYIRAAEAQTADLSKNVTPNTAGAPSLRHLFGARVGNEEASDSMPATPEDLDK